MNPQFRWHSYEQSGGDAEQFSLAPVEGERVGVRGTVVPRSTNSSFNTSARPLTLTLSPSEGERDTSLEW